VRGGADPGHPADGPGGTGCIAVGIATPTVPCTWPWWSACATATHRAYVERRTKQGLSKPEIMRCIKRYLAREVYHAIPADFQALHAT
jgi:hypothetical protein